MFHVVTVLHASRVVVIDTAKIAVMIMTVAHFPDRNESVNRAEFLFASTVIAFAAARLHLPMTPGYGDVVAFLYSAFKKRVRSCHTSMACGNINNEWLLRHSLLYHSRL